MKTSKLPVELRSAYMDDYTILYQAPKGYTFNQIPEQFVLKSEFGNYSIAFEKVGDNLKVKRNLVLNKGNFKPEEYTNYVNFIQKINGKDNTKILINKL